MDGNKKLSRRNMLRGGAAVASGVAITAGVETAATADSGTADSAPHTGKRADVARVTGRESKTLTLQANKSAAARQPAEKVPFVGFPNNVVPRTGDLVTIVEDWPGYALAAVPLCHWLTGVPKALPNGEVSVSGARMIASPELAPGLQTRKLVKVCVLDTELETAQVLMVRPG
jgi:hypothetical protein